MHYRKRAWKKHGGGPVIHPSSVINRHVRYKAIHYNRPCCIPRINSFATKSHAPVERFLSLVDLMRPRPPFPHRPPVRRLFLQLRNRAYPLLGILLLLSVRRSIIHVA